MDDKERLLHISQLIHEADNLIGKIWASQKWWLKFDHIKSDKGFILIEKLQVLFPIVKIYVTEFKDIIPASAIEYFERMKMRFEEFNIIYERDRTYEGLHPYNKKHGVAVVILGCDYSDIPDTYKS